MKSFTQTLKIIIFALIIGLGVNYLYAWTGPPGSPPTPNAAPPINVSDRAQLKEGSLILGAGNSGLLGLAQSITDNAGEAVGIMDHLIVYGNAVVHATLGVGPGASGGTAQLAVMGGDVGIGITSPTARLHIKGGWGAYEDQGLKIERSGAPAPWNIYQMGGPESLWFEYGTDHLLTLNSDGGATFRSDNEHTVVATITTNNAGDTISAGWVGAANWFNNVGGFGLYRANPWASVFLQNDGYVFIGGAGLGGASSSGSPLCIDDQGRLSLCSNGAAPPAHGGPHTVPANEDHEYTGGQDMSNLCVAADHPGLFTDGANCRKMSWGPPGAASGCVISDPDWGNLEWTGSVWKCKDAGSTCKKNIDMIKCL